MKTMRLFKYTFCALFACVAGCSLSSAPDVGMHCPNAVEYLEANGVVAGSFNDPQDIYYELYAEYGYCPVEYPDCYNNADNTVCHTSCRDNEIFCLNRCVVPAENTEYCGARGLCNESDPGSDNYIGQKCVNGQHCADGTCACIRSWEIACGDNCIDPDYEQEHCGARGLCSDSNSESENYYGQKCSYTEICNAGIWECANTQNISCNGSCINPNNNIGHCGAKGECSDQDENSPNFKGYQCQGGQICDEGECVCAKTSEIFCNNECIDPNTNASHCGARGLCNHSQSDNSNFQGWECFRCEKGKCLSCNQGNHVYGDGCELDSTDNCGEHGHKCELGDYSGAETLACQNKIPNIVAIHK